MHMHTPQTHFDRDAKKIEEWLEYPTNLNYELWLKIGSPTELSHTASLTQLIEWLRGLPRQARRELLRKAELAVV